MVQLFKTFFIGALASTGMVPTTGEMAPRGGSGINDDAYQVGFPIEKCNALWKETVSYYDPSKFSSKENYEDQFVSSKVYKEIAEECKRKTTVLKTILAFISSENPCNGLHSKYRETYRKDRLTINKQFSEDYVKAKGYNDGRRYEVCLPSVGFYLEALRNRRLNAVVVPLQEKIGLNEDVQETVYVDRSLLKLERLEKYLSFSQYYEPILSDLNSFNFLGMYPYDSYSVNVPANVYYYKPTRNSLSSETDAPKERKNENKNKKLLALSPPPPKVEKKEQENKKEEVIYTIEYIDAFSGADINASRSQVGNGSSIAGNASSQEERVSPIAGNTSSQEERVSPIAGNTSSVFVVSAVALLCFANGLREMAKWGRSLCSSSPAEEIDSKLDKASLKSRTEVLNAR